MQLSRRSLLRTSAGTAAVIAFGETLSARALGASPSLAGVALGDTAQSVVQRLGLPQARLFAHGSGAPEWVYQGLVVRFASLDPRSQAVKSLHLVDSRGGAAEFGIRVGSTVADLRRAYGQAVEPYPSGRGYRHNITPIIGLDFVVVDGTIVRIVLEDRSCITCSPGRVGPRGEKK